MVNDSSADLGPSAFFDLTDPTVAALFKDVAYVWDVVRQIPELVRGLLREAQDSSDQGGLTREDDVHISPGARIEPDVYIQGPTFIGPGVAIRHGAYVRGNCILLDGAVLGHASEMKNSILLPKAKAPHFSYVGDSVLGSRSNLGAGTKLSNVQITTISGPRPSIIIEVNGVKYDTGLTKLGAIVGDDVHTGCNCVTSPGALLGRGVVVYPNTTVPKGLHPSNAILKLRQEVELGLRTDK